MRLNEIQLFRGVSGSVGVVESVGALAESLFGDAVDFGGHGDITSGPVIGC